MPIFYRPEPEVAAADFIPFYWQGDYHLFYLWADRTNTTPPGTPWHHLVTRDFLHFEDWGEAIPRGTPEEQDQWVFTGSVIERQGTFYIYYTGHNPAMRQRGRPLEVILRATSSDLRTWQKDRRFSIEPPVKAGYAPDDWRDPFVFWNTEVGEYWMLLAARRPNAGPVRRQGLVALMASDDLTRWELREPLWAPDEYATHECPDLFKIGPWWYLFYSTFSDRFATHYRMAQSPRGPWLAPANEACDGRAFYAAKSAGDGTRRYLFGWLADRQGATDEGAWEWGGSLVTHELLQRGDGTLGVRPPEAVVAAFTTPLPLSPQPVLGEWRVQGTSFIADSASRFSVLTLGALPGECLLETEATYLGGTQSLGLLLRASADLESYYQLRLEPARQRMVVDRWPRPGDQPFLLERPLRLEVGKPVRLRLLLDGTCLVAYADDIALSCRLYEHAQGGCGLFVTEGQAEFHGMKINGR